MKEPTLVELVQYLRALAELRKAGYHTTLETKSTIEAIEQQLSKN
ncbi:hypothetical protein V1502_17010 [Bacillus sp. SCS-153A]